MDLDGLWCKLPDCWCRHPRGRDRLRLRSRPQRGDRLESWLWLTPRNLAHEVISLGALIPTLAEVRLKIALIQSRINRRYS
jgi:hypothetical protein